MKITKHRFDAPIWFGQSKDVGEALKDPKFIVMHYTAGGDGAASRDYMMLSPTEKQKRNGGSKPVHGSAHLVIDRNGDIWQIVPFDVIAHHAGASSWRGHDGLNQYSIGIEIANYGWLDRQGDGSYKRSDTRRFPAKDVTVGPMPGNPHEIKGWENYPEKQLAAVEQVTRALLGQYSSIVEIVGHQDIAPGRKFDPGPAFPIRRFQNLLDSRAIGGGTDKAPAPKAVSMSFAAITALNVRGGPGAEYDKLDISPLRAGTVLHRIEEHAPWMLVQVSGQPGVRGWVHQQYVRLLGENEATEEKNMTVSATTDVAITLSAVEGKPGILTLFVTDLATSKREEVQLHGGKGTYKAINDGRAHLFALYTAQAQSDEFTVEAALSVQQPPATLVVGVDLNPSANPRRGSRHTIPFPMTKASANGTIKFGVEKAA